MPPFTSPLRGMVRLLCCGCLLFVPANSTNAGEPKEPTSIKDFSLQDTESRLHRPADWNEAKAVVLFFLGTECPVSNGYAPEMSRLATKYAKIKVLFWGIHPDPDVTVVEATRHAREYRLLFPVLLDPFHELAGPTGIRVTPEVVLLEPGGKIRYRGRIDDKYTEEGKRREVVRSQDLDRAIEAMLADKEIVPAETRAFGCPLPKPSKKPK